MVCCSKFSTKKMISIFPLWTFHSYVATFQQHLHMEYISLSWYDITEPVVHIRISLISCVVLTRKLLNQGFLLVQLKSRFEILTVATMTCLTAMTYLCHNGRRICSTCGKHFPFLSSFMTDHRVCNWINTTGVTSGARTAHPSGAPEFNPDF